MKRPKPFHPGDLVEIVRPVFVTRVGYPKCVDDYIQDVRNHRKDLEIYLKACRVMGPGVSFHPTLLAPTSAKLLDRLEREVAYLLAKGDHFGGRERKLHTIEHPQHAGKQCRVSSIRTACTGTYYPPSGGYDSYNGDYDYEPGGLINEKRHRLAEVTLCSNDLEILCMNNYLEIEVSNIKHLEEP